MSRPVENDALEQGPGSLAWDTPNVLQAQSEPRSEATQEESADLSSALFCMYLDKTITKDKEMVESWKGDADKILIFTGVFSATVAALLVMSVPNIVQNPQDTSAFYLAHIHQQLSTQPNGSRPSIPSSLSNPTEPFSPPSSGVWVNGLWFLSLVISLTCALLATLAQQWARQYLENAYPVYPRYLSPHKRARLRAFRRRGVDKLHIPWTMEAVPVLLHLSLFLFFVGLSVFLFGVNHTIFKAVTARIALCVILYACLTIFPFMYKSSPYSTPLSAPVFFSLTVIGGVIRYLFFRLLLKFPQIGLSIFMIRRDPRGVQLTDFLYSMSKTAEAFAFKMHPEIDYESLGWTLDSLDEDADLEKFFECLPRLCDSKRGRDLDIQQGFIKTHKQRLSSALIGLMNRTLPHNLVAESVRQHRMIICIKVVNSTSLLGPWWILRCVLLGEWSKFLECIEFGHFLQNWKNITDKVNSFAAQCVAALTISILRDRIRDARWFQLAGDLLNVRKPVLYKYLAHGDSIQLANTIFIVRRTVQTYSGAKERHRQDIFDVSLKTLETVCKFDIGGTLPELRHQFCGLWNQLVNTALTDPRPHYSLVCTITLWNIRKLYIALHESPADAHLTPFYSTTDDPGPILENPKSFPVCTHDDHRPSLDSPPIPDLQLDEPVPDAPGGDVAPSMMLTHPFVYPLARPLTYTTPVYPSFLAPDPIPSVPSHCDPRPCVVGTNTHLAAPPEATIPFPQPQLTQPHDLNNVPRWGNVQSPPAPAQTQTPAPPPPMPPPPLPLPPPPLLLPPPPRPLPPLPPPPLPPPPLLLPPPPPRPPRSAYSASPTASSTHLGDVSTQHCSSGGHVWSSPTT